MLTFGPTVNRSLSLYLPFRDDHISVRIFFSKNNTFIGFVTDREVSQMCRSGQVCRHLYKDLRKSSFANTFLDISNVRSPNLDIRCQFSNILPGMTDKIEYVTNETVKLSKVKTKNGSFESNIFIYVFTFSDYPNDFLFFLAERHHIDTLLNKKLVRTSALQISTKQCLDDLNKMVTMYNGKTEDQMRNETKSVDDAISDIFPDKNSIHVRRA